MMTMVHESHLPRGHMHSGTDVCIPESEHRRGTAVLACSDKRGGNRTTTTPSVEVRRPGNLRTASERPYTETLCGFAKALRLRPLCLDPLPM